MEDKAERSQTEGIQVEKNFPPAFQQEGGVWSLSL
jgi:hypothetical protein